MVLKVRYNVLPMEIAPLLEFGLNKYEASIYLALVNEGALTARDVSNITGVPYGKIYEMIASLSSKGFVSVLPLKPMRCRAISPKEVMERVRKAFDRKLAKLEEHVQVLEPKFRSRDTDTDITGGFVLVKGRENIDRKICELVSSARSHINVLTMASRGFRYMPMSFPQQKSAGWT